MEFADFDHALTEPPRTKSGMSLTELLEKHDEGDFLRAVAEAVLQLIMEADVEGVIGAGRHERAKARTTYRNGYRDRALDTRPRILDLRVPKLRAGRPERCPSVTHRVKFSVELRCLHRARCREHEQTWPQHEYFLDPKLHRQWSHGAAGVSARLRLGS